MFAIKTGNGYFASQGDQSWIQDKPIGWAIFLTEKGAIDVAAYWLANGSYKIEKQKQ